MKFSISRGFSWIFPMLGYLLPGLPMSAMSISALTTTKWQNVLRVDASMRVLRQLHFQSGPTLHRLRILVSISGVCQAQLGSRNPGSDVGIFGWKIASGKYFFHSDCVAESRKKIKNKTSEFRQVPKHLSYSPPTGGFRNAQTRDPTLTASTQVQSHWWLIPFLVLKNRTASCSSCIFKSY